jgi:hypothetical protein
LNDCEGRSRVRRALPLQEGTMQSVLALKLNLGMFAIQQDMSFSP